MARSSIRGRTMWALSGVGAATAALVGLVTTRTMTGEIYNQVRRANESRARTVRAHVKGRIADGVEMLEQVARHPDLREVTEESLDRVLGDAILYNPIFYSIYAYDPAGEVVLRRYLRGREGDEGRSRSLAEKADGPFVRNAWATLKDGRSRLLEVRGSSWGNLFIPCLTAIPGAAGAPPRGLLSGAISAAGRGFEEMIQGLAPGRTGYVVLMDQRETVLAATEGAPVQVGERFPHPVRPARGQLLVARPGGGDLAARAEVREFGMHVLVALPRREALESLPDALLRIAGATLAALVLAALLGIWLAERLTGPIAELLEGIRQVGDGVLTHRVRPGGDDELGEVAEAFNRLAETLARNRMIEEFWNDPDLDGSEASGEIPKVDPPEDGDEDP